MINVVFLLLIFFLMSARFLPPEPVEIALPASIDAGERALADTLYVAPDGMLFYEGAAGDEALARVATRVQDVALFIRADASAPATVIAELLPKLAAAGVRETRLVTRGP